MAVFALVDTATHKLYRPGEWETTTLPTAERDSVCPPPPALKARPAMAPVGEWTVPYSAVDFNRHLNNTVYADLLWDHLPAPLREQEVTAYALQYLTEAKEGQALTLWYGTDGEAHYVEVRHGGTVCFVGRVEMGM